VARKSDLGFSPALLFTLWLVFKHGFVRQDFGQFSQAFHVDHCYRFTDDTKDQDSPD